MQLRRAEGVRCFALDEGAVLYCDAEQEIHALDPAAALAWRLAEQGLSHRALCAEYARALPVGPAEAERVLTDVLQDWRARGWLVEGSSVAPTAHPPRRALRRGSAARATSTRRDRPRRTRARHYRLLDTAFALRLPRGPLEELVASALTHLESGESSAVDVVLEVEAQRSGYTLREWDAIVEHGVPLCSVTPLVKLHLRRIAIARHRFFMEIHAAAVLSADGAWLFPGARGHGKTTLSAGLVAAGHPYLTDELILLEPGSLRVRPLPLALTVKPGALAVLEAVHPGVAGLAVHRREDGERVRYLAPGRASLALDLPEGHAVRGLVFPHYAPDATLSLSPMTRLEALRRLLECCLSLPEWLDAERVGRLVEWIRELECYELRASSLGPAIDALTALLGTPGARSSAA